LERTVCWAPLWNPRHPGAGLEHLRLQDGDPGTANSVVLGIDDTQGAFRLDYQLVWRSDWSLQSARLVLQSGRGPSALTLLSDGQGHWHDGGGQPLGALDGCLDIDIWPTPFTNTFPMRRVSLALGERREFVMAWVDGTTLTVTPQRQAYTRLSERSYLFESLAGSGFKAELPVDANSLVLDYPDLFHRVWPAPDA
jgi:uncharacterized protein